MHAARNALASPHTGQYCFPQPGMYCMKYTACQYAEERHCRTASPRGQTERETRCGQTEHAPAAYPCSHPHSQIKEKRHFLPASVGSRKPSFPKVSQQGSLNFTKTRSPARRVTREGAGREFETGNRTGDTRKKLNFDKANGQGAI